MIRKTIYTIMLLLLCSVASAQSIAEHPQLKLMNYLLNELGYNWYISDEEFKTTIILPTDEGMLRYIDPVSYGQTPLVMFSFTGSDRSSARVEFYECEFDKSSGKWVKLSGEPVQKGGISSGGISKRLSNLLESMIIKGEYKDGQLYYKTMGNMLGSMIVRIDGIEKGSNVYGPLQMELNTPLKVVDSFEEKGCRVIVVDGPIMGAQKSVCNLLAGIPDFSKFNEMLTECCSVSTTDYSTAVTGANLLYWYLHPSWRKSDIKRRNLLDNFNYTIYVPTNEAMDEAFERGLPTMDDLMAAYEYDARLEQAGEVGDSALKIKEVMCDFIKYHIQDFSVFIDKNAKNGRYSTAMNEFIYEPYTDGESDVVHNYTVGKPYRVNVDASETSMRVTDAMGNVRNVITSGGLYNMVANEYWVSSNNFRYTPQTANKYSIQEYSTVVVHAIDGPLFFANDQFVYKPVQYYINK